jgi:hypothetical protein
MVACADRDRQRPTETPQKTVDRLRPFVLFVFVCCFVHCSEETLVFLLNKAARGVCEREGLECVLLLLLLLLAEDNPQTWQEERRKMRTENSITVLLPDAGSSGQGIGHLCWPPLKVNLTAS